MSNFTVYSTNMKVNLQNKTKVDERENNRT